MSFFKQMPLCLYPLHPSKMWFLCKTSAYHYVKQAFSASQGKGMSLSSCELEKHSVPFFFDFEKFYKTSSSHTLAWAGAACERFEADRDSIHQPLHLCLMALCRHSCLPACLMCAYRMPTSSFYVRKTAGSTASGFANGFFNPVVCWEVSFQAPRVLKPKPKMYLNTSIRCDSRLPVIVCFDWLKHFRDRQRGSRGRREGREMRAGKARTSGKLR